MVAPENKLLTLKKSQICIKFPYICLSNLKFVKTENQLFHSKYSFSSLFVRVTRDGRSTTTTTPRSDALSRNIGTLTVRQFSVVTIFLSSSKQITKQCLNLCHLTFLVYFFQFIIHDHPTMRRKRLR